MAINEPSSSSFARGLEKCAATCSKEIHAACFQRDGTRHVTMFEGGLQDEIARAIRFTDTFTPLSIKIDGWQPWKGGCYLKLTESTTEKLKSLLELLEGLPEPESKAGRKRPCDHISLYRGRGHGASFFRQAAKVRKVLTTHDWGNAQGVSIRIKVLGSEYNECRVLAGV
jgi:hypothetical protein